MQALAQETVSISDLLDSRENIAPLFPLEILATPPVRFDLSRENPNLQGPHPDAVNRHVSDTLSRTGCLWGYGGWAEVRHVYPTHRGLPRTQAAHVIHLGLDIWLPPSTPIFAPMTGSVHSFADNKAHLDYGPTIITEHRIGEVAFYMLLGHLSRESLHDVQSGKALRYGDLIGHVGDQTDSASLMPHLHIQLITDMDTRRGHFPGVARPSERERYLALCPSPEALLTPFLVA